MDLYTALIAAHIILAIVWVGGALMVQILDLRGIGVSNRSVAPTLLPALGWVASRVFAPSAVLVPVTGALLIYLGGSFEHGFWIDVSLALSVVAFLLGAAVIGPSMMRVQALLTAAPSDGAITTYLTRARIASRIEILLLLTVVVLMVFKPF